MPILFGLYDFKDFTDGKPVILTEGIKDALVIKQFYPYVLAVNTSGLTSKTMAIVEELTDTFVLAYDNDNAGNTGAEVDRVKILKKDKDAFRLLPYKGYKDFAGMIGNSEGMKDLENAIFRVQKF